MTNSTKISIVGAGKMGSAMLRALLPNFPQTQAYDKGTNLEKELTKADVVIIAVKPQDFTQLQLNLSEKLVISIMAGVSIEKIATQLNTKQVVRSMPNLPLQIGEGLTAWLATPEVSHKELIKEIFGSFGQEIELTSEEEIDKITPLSGSGPAYFFYLCKLLEENAKALGFSPAAAKKIAEQTFTGSAKIFTESDKTADEWITAVASKKGVTQEVIDHFNQSDVPTILQDGIEKGIQRSKELNQ